MPGSESVAGNRTVHVGTWESHVVPDGSSQQAEEARREYGGMAVGPAHSRGGVVVMRGKDTESTGSGRQQNAEGK